MSFRASTEALAKKDMKPSFTPCFFSKLSLAVARFHHRRHVNVVEGGEQSGIFLRALQTLGDRLAQAGHLDALFATLVGAATTAGTVGAPLAAFD
jgi:hypothetical protein